MDLYVRQSINNVNAFGFELLRPLNVALFVEAGLQFHQHGYLLLILNGFEQRLDNGRITADAIERHLDREDVRILSGGTEKIDYRLE